jgi:hypothetical protein
MPLQKVTGQQYLHRQRIFIDPYTDNISPDDDGSIDRIIVGVDKHPEKVASIEMTNYNFPLSMAPAFKFPTDTDAGSNTLDIRMQDYPAAANTLEFSVTLPSSRMD